MQKLLFIQYKPVFTILHLVGKVGKVIVPLIFETTGRNVATISILSSAGALREHK